MSLYNDNKDLFLNPQVKQYGGSHMVMTNVQRESKHKVLCIDTKYCDEFLNNRTIESEWDYNISNYNFTIPDKLTGVRSMSIKSVEIPMTYYNICAASGNNFFNVTVYNSNGSLNTQNITVTVPDGVYDTTNIAAAINTAISGAGITNLTYSLNTSFVSKFAFTSSSSAVYYHISFYLDKSGDFSKYGFKSKLGWCLGFRNLTYTVANTTGVRSEGVIQLNQKYMYLAIDDYSNSNPVSFLSSMPKYFINKNIIAKILLDRNAYLTNTILCASKYNGLLFSDTRVFDGEKHNIQKLNIKLLDENGNCVNLNGNDFSFTMCLE